MSPALSRMIAASVLGVSLAGCGGPSATALDADNPVRAIGPPPYGMEEFFAQAAPLKPEQVRLGRWLFFDRRLSADSSISCATCHRPEHAFSQPEALPTGIGGQRGTRRTPGIINLGAYTALPDAPDPGPSFFWDGRATSLEAQVLVPIADRKEMGLDHAAMVSRLSAVTAYRPYFREAFEEEAITAKRVASAIAEYLRSRRSGNAPYDRWAYGRDGRAMSAEAQDGSDIFFFRGRCAMCHAGFNFSDGRFYNLGVGWDRATQSFRDEGRATVTGRAADRGKFKTPSLRDVAKRPPYMHDGSLATLREVVEFYNRGAVKAPGLSARIRPIGLSGSEIDALVSFLTSLNGEGYEDRSPRYFPQ